MKELTGLALDTAKGRGASYADIRICRYRRQNVSTREDHIESLSDSEDFGFGVRALVDGTWGFAASNLLTKEEVQRVAALAVEIARANAQGNSQKVTLAPTPAYQDVWQNPFTKDPFKVSIERKIDLLLAINREAMKVKGARFVSSQMNFVREEKTFASTEGSYIEQTIVRCSPGYTVTAVDETTGEFETRSHDAPPIARGYEHVEESGLLENAQRVAEEAVIKLTAKSVEPGKKDIVLHPTNLWLTIHESVGHPTELDRALGYEANFAGTSFCTPDKLGALRYGSPIVNIYADKTTPFGLATVGYDDDGVRTSRWHLVREGIFVDYQTTREQAGWIGQRESHGCAYADSWSSIPFQRMPNVSLEPGPDPIGVPELIAGIKDGIYIVGEGSWSIDQQRYNFQFTGDFFFEIKDGKIVGPLKDVAYQSNSVEFWNACDAIAGPALWMLGGSFYDGKGEPMQVNAVSHGCSPARFRQVNILNTRRKV